MHASLSSEHHVIVAFPPTSGSTNLLMGSEPKWRLRIGYCTKSASHSSDLNWAIDLGVNILKNIIKFRSHIRHPCYKLRYTYCECRWSFPHTLRYPTPQNTDTCILTTNYAIPTASSRDRSHIRNATPCHTTSRYKIDRNNIAGSKDTKTHAL